MPSASVPWGPPNKKTPAVAWVQQSAHTRLRRSWRFGEYFNRLLLHSQRKTFSAWGVPHPRKKNQVSSIGAEVLLPRAALDRLSENKACRTEACLRGRKALSTGRSERPRRAPSLDQRGSHVYSSIIRTGHSPPSQLSTLNPVIAGKGFLCLWTKESGNLVEC